MASRKSGSDKPGSPRPGEDRGAPTFTLITKPDEPKAPPTKKEGK